jgi:hypothetical protein
MNSADKLSVFQQSVLAEIHKHMRPVFAFDNAKKQVSIYLEPKGFPKELKDGLFIVTIEYRDDALTIMDEWIVTMGFGSRDTCRIVHVDLPRKMIFLSTSRRGSNSDSYDPIRRAAALQASRGPLDVFLAF